MAHYHKLEILEETEMDQDFSSEVVFRKLPNLEVKTMTKFDSVEMSDYSDQEMMTVSGAVLSRGQTLLY